MAARKSATGGGAVSGQVVQDPGVTIGPFRLLQRTDGKWLAYDDRQPLGKMDVFVKGDRDTVEKWMKANAGK